MSSPVARFLKQRTTEPHKRIEALLAPELSAHRLRAVLGRFAGFWQCMERLADEWARDEPELAQELRWTRRRRGEALRCDLLRLGLTVRELTALPEAPPVFDMMDIADVLGWIYVAERSTLGSAARDAAQLRLRTFSPYLEGPGPMWRSYLKCLGEWVGTDDSRCDAVIIAAETCFVALEKWLFAEAAA